MTESIPIILIAISLFAYSVFLMIECGAATLLAAPAVTGDPDLASSYVGPVWETTNVFLVFALVALMAFFPGAVTVWGTALAFPFFAFLAIAGLRSIGMLYAVYHRGTNTPLREAFVAVSLATPITFAAAVIPFFLVGQMPYGPGSWLVAFDLGVFAFAATLFISYSFFFWRTSGSSVQHRVPGDPLEFFAATFAILFVAAGAFLLLTLPVIVPHLAPGLGGWTAAFFALALIEAVLLLPRRGISARLAGWRFAVAVALFAAAFFAIAAAQLPYLVYPSVTAAAASAGGPVAGMLLWVFLGGFIIVLPSLYFLFHLFLHPRR